MKKKFFKITTAVFVLGLLTLIPLNAKLTFGYTPDPYQCNKEVPDKVVLYEPNHVLLPRATGQGEVRLNWLKANRANKYSVGFGVESGKYIYGSVDVGNTDHFIVRYLAPGKKYYFAVKGVNDCMPGEWSREWAAVVGRGGLVTILTRTTGTGSTGGNILPSPTGSRRQTIVNPTNVPSVVPTAVENNNLPLAPENVVQPTPTPAPGFFQRILNFFGLGGGR